METTAPDFVQDSAVDALGAGRYAARITRWWSTPNGPNGGYIAALVVRALEAEIADATRPLRSLTLHYLRSPRHDADAEIEVTVHRSGRSLTTATARLLQDGELCVLAVAALSVAFPTAMNYETAMPSVPPPQSVPLIGERDPAPEIARRLEIRHALGSPPFSQSQEATTGGWMRLRRPAPIDAAALALLIDGWLPSAWSRLDRFAPAPTIDLTIHFRAPALLASLDPEVPLLARFSSTTSRDGLFEEDGWIWAPDGALLAQGRQLAVLRPGPGAAEAGS